jgi:hypothetical protein
MPDRCSAYDSVENCSARNQQPLPVLRWSDAHHRNPPQREKAAVTGTAPGDGSMMKGPSPRLIQSRFPREHRSRGDCPGPREPTQMAGLSLDPATGASAIFGKGSLCAHPSRLKPRLIIMTAPCVGTLSSLTAPGPPRLRPSEVCQRGPPSLGGIVALRSTSKNLQES